MPALDRNGPQGLFTLYIREALIHAVARIDEQMSPPACSRSSPLFQPLRVKTTWLKGDGEGAHSSMLSVRLWPIPDTSSASISLTLESSATLGSLGIDPALMTFNELEHIHGRQDQHNISANFRNSPHMQNQ